MSGGSRFPSLGGAFACLSLGIGSLKGQTAIVRDVAFGHKNLSGLAVFVELETFGSAKQWIEYEHTVEER